MKTFLALATLALTLIGTPALAHYTGYRHHHGHHHYRPYHHHHHHYRPHHGHHHHHHHRPYRH